MSNPFENDNADYLVVRNDELQHALWPATAAVPAGWTRVHGPAPRQSCLDHVERNWTDMRPASLVAALAGNTARD
ncbi:MbtH family protein [Streptomyces sp. TR1341]|uniref:MbtH protein n=1 Tax=Streptomyces murinus TaxID=33900 RepID=A0A7W3NV16_STRMR|nr:MULTISPECIES: MbtH family protein [Streptomyces]NDK25683.1 MbtH family protein [Streptomyces sp. TR1341]MBA9057198.1 MbtH protein [Streptomyces murinus]UWW91543.1 MbtH family NRPS accessory protein [Streptomyces murinus]WSI88806.1 MbtH family protein [Streptomyces murinus]WUD10474.1 MbtH family protein [Streptomyces murinus]